MSQTRKMIVVLGKWFIIPLLVIFLQEESSCGNDAKSQFQELDKEIIDTKKILDSLNLEIRTCRNDTSSGSDSSYYQKSKIFYTLKLDSLDTIKINMVSTIYTDESVPFCKFRDSVLEHSYYKGYYNPKSADEDINTSISATKGIACNAGIGNITYGFVNLHNRKKPLKINFEYFQRIGVYSMFPETIGCIEMIFAENKTVPGKKFEELTKQAHRYNTKVDLVLSCYNWNDKRKMMPWIDQSVVMHNIVDSVTKIIKNCNFDGLTIDFDISRMSIKTIMYYKDFIFRLHKEFKTISNRPKLNIIVSAKDILDTTKHSISDIHDSINQPVIDPYNPKKDNHNNDFRVDTIKRTKFELLLLPDQFNCIDYILVNLDFSYVAKSNNYKSIVPIYGKQDNDSVIGIKTLINKINKDYDSFTVKTDYNSFGIQTKYKRFIGVLPLYGNIWRDTLKTKIIGNVVQKEFNKIEDISKKKTYKEDFKFIEDGKQVFTDDQSIDILNEKVDTINANIAGIGIWQIEYADSSFNKILAEINDDALKGIIGPRIIIIKYFNFLRVLIGPNRLPIGIVLIVFLSFYFGMIIYIKIAGRDKIIIKYKSAFIISGILLILLTYLFLLVIPIKISTILEIVYMLAMLLSVLIGIAYYMYKLNRSKDLP